jgi:hypothetical protein
MTIAHDAHPSEDHDDTVQAHYASLERPHACYEGVVYVGHLVVDPGTGEEVEVIEAVPCRRCADSRWPHPDSLCSYHKRGRHQGRAFQTSGHSHQ